MRFRVISLAGVLLLAGLATAAKADEFVVNGTFSPANPTPGYGPVSGWTEVGGAGSNGTSGPIWDNGTIPTGQTVGFLQGDASFSQTLSGLTPGATYTLSFVDNARLCVPGCNATPSLTVLLDGSTLLGPTAVTPVGSNPFYVVSDTFLATSATETLEFLSATPNGNDGALLLSDVSVSTSSSPVPEPSSLMLLGTGVLGAAGMMRRRFLQS